MSTPLEIELFYRSDCHLCDQMNSQVSLFIREHALQDDVAIRYRDIEEREEWFDYYREHIPVIVVAREEVCHYFFDPRSFRDALSAQGVSTENPS